MIYLIVTPTRDFGFFEDFDFLTSCPLALLYSHACSLEVLAGGLAEARFRRGRTIVTETSNNRGIYVLTLLFGSVE